MILYTILIDSIITIKIKILLRKLIRTQFH